MAIVKMKRLRLLALAADRDEVLQRLLRAGCVEITEPDVEINDPEWTALVERERPALGQVKGRATGVHTALETLRKYAPVKSGLFILRQDVDEQAFFDAAQRAATLEKAAEINEMSRQIGQLHSQGNRLNSSRLGLMPWVPLNVDLSLKGTRFTDVIFGTCPADVELPALQSALAEAAPATVCTLSSSDRELHYLMLLCHKEEREQAMETLRGFAFNPQQFKDTTGPAAENIEAIERELAALEEKREQLGRAIAAEAGWRDRLKLCVDQMALEIAKEEARGRLVTTGSLIFFKGWVPQPDAKQLESSLEGISCALSLSDPADDENPPTLLRNSRLVHSMEMVTEMYSLPAYKGIDPNPLIFPFFSIFFGMMYADMAYGLILIILSQIVARKYKPKGTFGNIMQLATICGFTAFVWGALSGGLFGDAYTVVMEVFFNRPGLSLPALINPLENPMNVLTLALVMGAIQLLFGQLVNIYMNFRDGTPWEGILSVVPWWIVFAGIAVLVTGGSSLVLLLGALALICTQGRHKKGLAGKIFGGIASLYDITSWLGDILSYTRLMALMLAGTVIASVVNILGTLPGNIIVFFVIFLIGHAFNMGINIIGTYVHAARLQYLEFFGKFYQDGGVPFNPLFCHTKYVDIVAHKEVEQDG